MSQTPKAVPPSQVFPNTQPGWFHRLLAKLGILGSAALHAALSGAGTGAATALVSHDPKAIAAGAAAGAISGLATWASGLFTPAPGEKASPF